MKIIVMFTIAFISLNLTSAHAQHPSVRGGLACFPVDTKDEATKKSPHVAVFGRTDYDGEDPWMAEKTLSLSYLGLSSVEGSCHSIGRTLICHGMQWKFTLDTSHLLDLPHSEGRKKFYPAFYEEQSTTGLWSYKRNLFCVQKTW